MDTRSHATEAPTSGELLFGRYRVECEIGRGGMGVVMLARDLELDTAVAVKLVPDLIVQDKEGLEQLKHEVLRGMALTHPNIVRTHGFERDARMAAIIMEFVDGGNFIELKRAHHGGCMDASQLLPWLEQLCPVLDYAHFDIRIAHRDLKPHNLMYSAAGRLKVADFGISSTLNETGTRITMQDASSGTPAYMSPQQVMGERASHLDDIYSLGATLYELLTGKPPFYQGQVLAQVLEAVPAPMTERRKELGLDDREAIPAVWEDTVAACLAKDALRRPHSAGEILARLTGNWSAAAAPEPPVPATGRRGGKGRRWAAGIAATATLAGAGFAWVRHRPVEMEERQPFRPPLAGLASLPEPAPEPVVEMPPPPAPEAPRLLVPDELPEALEGLSYRFPLSAEGGVPPHTWSSDGTLLPDGLALDESGLLHGIPTTPSRGGFGVKVTGGDGQASRRTVTLEVRAKAVVLPENPVLQEIPDPVVQMILAEKDKPYVNSLGMNFVPAGTPEVLFSTWLTRVRDFRAFVKATRHDATKDVLSFRAGGSPRLERNGDSWQSPGFTQDDEDPVCCVSWDDAVAFCRWLTEDERRSGELDESFEYRLPTADEWRTSLGIEGNSAKPLRYPWGYEWPPPEGRGNLAGQELFTPGAPSSWRMIPLRDWNPRTAAVNRYQPNRFGIHDFYGNLWQFCEDPTDAAGTKHRMMGGSWLTSDPEELRIDDPPAMDRLSYGRGADAGFRCVLSRTR